MTFPPYEIDTIGFADWLKEASRSSSNLWKWLSAGEETGDVTFFCC